MPGRSEKEELIFLGREMHEERNYSEETARSIDSEVSRLIADAFDQATAILAAKRIILDRIATTLLEKETLEKDEFDALIKDVIPAPALATVTTL